MKKFALITRDETAASPCGAGPGAVRSAGGRPRRTAYPRFQTLRLQALRGVSYLDFVEVRYGNGEQQHVDVHHVIGGDEDIDIAVNGRHVEAITVHGARNARDRYSRRAEIQVIGVR